MKGVQCYELFGGIALKNHTFSFSNVIGTVLLQSIKTINKRRVSTTKPKLLGVIDHDWDYHHHVHDEYVVVKKVRFFLVMINNLQPDDGKSPEVIAT